MVFDRAASTGNELGLFPGEYDTETGEMLGNYPQALPHLSYIAAAVALAEHRGTDIRAKGSRGHGVNDP